MILIHEKYAIMHFKCTMYKKNNNYKIVTYKIMKLENILI